MNKKFNVDIDDINIKGNIGTLSVYEERGSEHYLFKYSDEWLLNKYTFEIDPALPLFPTPNHSRELWGIFQDISPDRWGQLLQERAAEGRYLSAAGYMAGVSDYMRLGAIRLSDQNDPNTYLADHASPPDLTKLRALESAVTSFEHNKITNKELQLLLEPGSSLGGARPKAVVEDEGVLYIAKFHSKNDSLRIINWEGVALELTKMAGISTAKYKLLNKDSKNSILLVERFDRIDGKRVHFASANTMLGGGRRDTSYIELADVIRKISADAPTDNYELWKRMTFNALICNTDDHMRNHGFLMTPHGWRLSPAYDINPNPLGYGMIHATFFNEQTKKPSLELCMELREYFGVNENMLKNALKNISDAIKQYPKVAKACGLSKSEIGAMAKVFEHRDIEKLNALVTKLD